MSGTEKNNTAAPPPELAARVLAAVTGELAARYPGFAPVLHAWAPVPGDKTPGIAFDGSRLHYSPDYVCRCFARSPAELRHVLMHTALHVALLHPFGPVSPLSGTAADMVVEALLEHEEGLDAEFGDAETRCGVLRRLGPGDLSTTKIEALLKEDSLPCPAAEIAEAFLMDDHRFWESSRPEKERWRTLGEGARQSGHLRSRRGSEPGTLQEKLRAFREPDYDYRQYLRRFAVQQEELRTDESGFDPIYYTLGLELYGNMPLIEHPETREGTALEELVIAIDTSGSITTEQVRAFLEHTHKILTGEENFFRRMNVYIMQCDCILQSCVHIGSEEEWRRYSRELTVVGRGGTDFDPVFRKVAELRGEGRLKNLKGLLYFTDGDGAYPEEPTDYETAFLFLEESDKMQMVPAWAKALVVGKGMNDDEH